MLLSADRSALLVIDIQERLLPAVQEPERVVARTRILLQAAAALKVPVFASEQYSKGIGRTVAPVAELLPESACFEKITFSCAGEPAIMAALNAAGRDQIVLCGIESHVCVLQTALALRALGRDVYVVADAVSSRNPRDMELGLARMAQDGIRMISSEMAVFEWMARAGTPIFKQLSALIK